MRNSLPDPLPLTSGPLSAASDGTRPVIPSGARADMFLNGHEDVDTNAAL